MKKKLLTLALVLLTTLAALALCHETACAIEATETTWLSLRGQKDYDAAFEVLELVNRERQEAGLGTLVMDQSLLDTAMQRAGELAIYYGHERPNGASCVSAVSTYFSSYCGENIAAGYSSSEAVMEGWMDSDGHRANILNGDYTCMGVGCFWQPGGYIFWQRGGYIFWVQVFAGPNARTVVSSSQGVVNELVWVETQYGKLELYPGRSPLSLTVGESTTLTLWQRNDGFPYSLVELDPSCLDYQVREGNSVELAGDGTVKAVRCGEGSLAMRMDFASGRNSYVVEYRVSPGVPVVTGRLSSGGKPKLSWPEIPGATGYEILRSTDGSHFDLYDSTTATSYTNTSARVGTTYYYRVRAWVQLADGRLESASSDTVSLTCRPGAPSVTAAGSSRGGVRLTWKAVDGAAEYQVYRSGYRNGTYTRCATVTGTGWTNTGATPGYTYYYKVRAVTSGGVTSDYSAVVSRTADCAAPQVSSKVMADSGGIRLSWDSVKGAGRYDIYRSTDGGKTYSRYTSTTSTSWTNKAVTPGKTYYYKVKAVCSRSSYGNSLYSNVVYRTADCARPSVTIQLNGGKPQLKWSAIDGAKEYVIYRATSKNGTYTKMYTTTKLSYTNTGAKFGKTYYYKVMAICAKSSYGNSAYSNVVSIKSR